MFAHDGNPDCHPGPPTNVPAPPFSAQEARRLIDHGLRLWDGRPRVREVVWREERRWYRLRATNTPAPHGFQQGCARSRGLRDAYAS